MALAISYRDITRRFGDSVALAPVTLDIAAGEFVALVGPSGCGKSTLLRLSADLDKPSSGTVLIGQEPPAVALQARRLGLVSQRPAVLPWKTALDDVLFNQRVSGRKGLDARSLLRDFGLAGHEAKRASEMSGGMVQRVNFASAIAHDPDVLLMDEPFSALDEMRREELGVWLGEALHARPRTVLFVTHHIDEAVLLADRVLVMSGSPGRIHADIRVDTPRPRSSAFRTDPLFINLSQRIRKLFAEALNGGVVHDR